MRFRSCFVGCQLNGPALLASTFFHSPIDHRLANLLTAPITRHANSFNLTTLQSPAGQSGDKRQLKGPNNLAPVVHNQQKLIRVRIDNAKSI